MVRSTWPTTIWRESQNSCAAINFPLDHTFCTHVVLQTTTFFFDYQAHLFSIAATDGISLPPFALRRPTEITASSRLAPCMCVCVSWPHHTHARSRQLPRGIARTIKIAQLDELSVVVWSVPQRSTTTNHPAQRECRLCVCPRIPTYIKYIKLKCMMARRNRCRLYLILNAACRYCVTHWALWSRYDLL